MTITSDEKLVERISMGDDQALSELYDRYSRPVYAMGVRLLGDTHLAEELVQDAFTSVWRRATTFDSGRASFATWLYRMARNRAVDLNRRWRARPISVGEEPLRGVSGGPEPEADLDGWDMGQALSSLPDDHRVVLTMAYFEGLSQREISQRMDLPLGTVKSRTTAALKRLRRALKNPFVEEAWYE